MTAEERAQIRDGAGGSGTSDGGSGDSSDATPAGSGVPGHGGRDGEQPGVPRHHRPARSGAAAGEGAARADGGGSAAEPGAGDSFGAWLRRQREMREIDLREIADKTKISLRYLKAMEQDRFEVLPAPVFARGFLREYARFVGLNPDEVVNYYLSAHGDEDDEEEQGQPAPAQRGGLSRGPLTRGALVFLLVLLVVAALVYLFVYQRNRSEQRQAAPPPIAPPVDAPRSAAPPTPEPSAGTAVEEEQAPSPAAAAPLVVTLDFTEQCWVEARVDGAEQVSRLYVAGESLRLEAQRRVVLQTLGNADGVEIQVNGEPFPVAAGASRTAHDVVIDLAQLPGGAAAGATAGGEVP